MLNVVKYIPYMDPMGYITSTKHQTHGLKLEKTLQPSNISTTKKPCHTPWQSWDAQEIPTMDPSKKKTKWHPHGIPGPVSRQNLDANFRTSSVNPSRQGPHRFKDSQKCHEFLWQRSFKHRAFFFSKGTFCSKQVILFINTKLGDVKCVFFCFFWKRHAIETR